MSASERWERSVADRAAAVQEIAGVPPPQNASSWDRRADLIAHRFEGTAPGDPLFSRLRPHVTPATSILDVGSGPGRFALALAPLAGKVVAVDPSARMLEILKATAEREGIGNLHCVHAAWEEAVVDPADIVVCAHVLPFVHDAASFLRRLHDHTKQRAFVYMNALGSEVPDPFWRHFHGRSLPPSPTYLDAVAVLAEIGIDAEVEIVELARVIRYPSLDEAVDETLAGLYLEDGVAVRAELRRLLEAWLVKDGDALRPPLPALPAAILSWRR